MTDRTGILEGIALVDEQVFTSADPDPGVTIIDEDMFSFAQSRPELTLTSPFWDQSPSFKEIQKPVMSYYDMAPDVISPPPIPASILEEPQEPTISYYDMAPDVLTSIPLLSLLGSTSVTATDMPTPKVIEVHLDTCLCELRVTDLTPDQIDILIIKLSDDLLIERRELEQIRHDCAEASRSWMTYMENRRRLLRYIRGIIRELKAMPDTSHIELGVCRSMKGKLLTSLGWAAKQWVALDNKKVNAAVMAVRTTEQKLEYLAKVRDVVILTDDFGFE